MQTSSILYLRSPDSSDCQVVELAKNPGAFTTSSGETNVFLWTGVFRSLVDSHWSQDVQSLLFSNMVENPPTCPFFSTQISIVKARSLGFVGHVVDTGTTLNWRECSFRRVWVHRDPYKPPQFSEVCLELFMGCSKCNSLDQVICWLYSWQSPNSSSVGLALAKAMVFCSILQIELFYYQKTII